MSIDDKWPDAKLEHVNKCPFCTSTKRKLAYANIQDWSFYTSTGNWTYWDCENCNALYLSERPQESFIHEAYGHYYTHAEGSLSIFGNLKLLLKNEFFSHLFEVNLSPRIGLSKKLSFVVKPLKYFLFVPFGMKQLIELPKGKLLDIGCGNGAMLKIAKDLGWDVTGIEIDPQAVATARKHGLKIVEGSYNAINQLNDTFDCIICSHVLEHVYNPLELINLTIERLSIGGSLLLSCPNSLSHMRQKFGGDWRGIEAPRHIAIPSLSFIESYLRDKNLQQLNHQDIFFGTYIESDRIKKRKKSISFIRFVIIKLKIMLVKKPSSLNSDYIQFVVKK